MSHADYQNHTGAASARIVSVLVLAAPACVLGFAAARYHSPLLASGAVAELLGGLLFVRYQAAWRPPASASVALLYIMALGWLWFATRTAPDAFAHASRGFFLVAVVGLVVGHDLIRTGLEPRRRAQKLCRRLANRSHWPATLGEFPELPEVRALAGVVREDAGPVIGLFEHTRAEVRAAALLTLRDRPYWRPGESAAVVRAIKAAPEPAVRAAGLTALSSATDPVVLGVVAGFLRDPAAEVRQAAIESLLAGGEAKWPAARDMIRDALANPNPAADAAVAATAGRLPAMAVCDLAVWACEPEPLASRAVRTLIAHFTHVLRTQDVPELPAELGRQIVDPQTPPALRVELAGLLRGLGLLTPALLDRMSDADQPGPVRLLAAEEILRHDPSDAEALDVLRGLGRQSNRDTAMAIARLLQTYLGMDMGLPDEAVATNSKQAVEAARRVLTWATGRPNVPSTPMPKLTAVPPGAPSSRPRGGPPPKAPPDAAPTATNRRSSLFRWLPG